MKTFICFLILLLGMSVTGEQVLDKVEEKYEEVQTMSAEFTQRIVYGSVDKRSEFSGRLILARPDKMRMTVLEPDTQLLISNSGSLWIYVKDAKQVLVYDLKEESYPQVGTLIFNMSKEFKSELTGRTQERYLLKLLPCQESVYYDSLYARISRRSHLVSGLTVFDKQANRIDYDFLKIRVNVETEGSEFTFTPPPGTEIIRSR